MAAFTNEVVTTLGQQLISRAVAGTATITFTKIIMGSGYPEVSDLRNATKVVKTEVILTIDEVKKNTDLSVSVKSHYNNSNLVTPFYYREKGLYATDGTTEILFCYANSGDSAELIVPVSQAIIEKTISSLFIPSTQDNISITYQSSSFAPSSVEFPAYTESTDLAALASGENITTAFGKIAKSISSLISHIATKATATVMGHVKLSNSSAVTETGTYALDATEKNSTLAGTLANLIYTLVNAVKAILAADYSASNTYVVGAYCIYNNTLYRCTTAIGTAEAWNAAHWTATTVMAEVLSLNTNLGNKLECVKVTKSVTVSTTGAQFIATNLIASIPAGKTFMGLAVDMTTGNTQYVSNIYNYKAGTATGGVLATISTTGTYVFDIYVYYK